MTRHAHAKRAYIKSRRTPNSSACADGAFHIATLRTMIPPHPEQQISRKSKKKKKTPHPEHQISRKPVKKKKTCADGAFHIFTPRTMIPPHLQQQQISRKPVKKKIHGVINRRSVSYSYAANRTGTLPSRRTTAIYSSPTIQLVKQDVKRRT